MQHTLFIADLHLDEKHQATTQYFLNFIQNYAQEAQALYILGDFFELWIGDDDENAYNNEIKRQLKLLNQKNIPVYFIHGNRDFLIGHKFSKETGCQILPATSIISLYGTNVLLLHGDALCSNDTKHMKFRSLTQNFFLRQLFLSLPLIIRRKIGTKLRSTSKKHHPATTHDLMGIVPATVTELLERNSVYKMIHGHIHTPRIFNFLINNQPAERIVLGAWDFQGSILKWYENGKREMVFFK